MSTEFKMQRKLKKSLEWSNFISKGEYTFDAEQDAHDKVEKFAKAYTGEDFRVVKVEQIETVVLPPRKWELEAFYTAQGGMKLWKCVHIFCTGAAVLVSEEFSGCIRTEPGQVDNYFKVNIKAETV